MLCLLGLKEVQWCFGAPSLFPVPAEYTTFVYNAPAPTAARRRG